MKSYDFIVIGAGAGGLTAAYTANGFGKKVLLIDKKRPGGDCTWSGCIPSKTLIRLSKEFYIAKKFIPTIKANPTDIMLNIKKTINEVYSNETPDKLKEDGIDFIFGEGRFIDKNIIDVYGVKYKGKKIILSTGSSPMIPQIEGLNNIDYLTNQSFFSLDSLPESITILGGGPIGVEMSQALNRLGVNINLVEKKDRILSKEEKEFSIRLQEILQSEGINLFLGYEAIEFTKNKDKVMTAVKKSDKTIVLHSDSLLLALGRVPNISFLNLDKVGIKYTKKGIVNDKHQQTSLNNVYAAGDICSPYQFSHMANMQGITAVKNSILPLKDKVDYENIAWCTFSDPELARAGLTEDDAVKKYGDKIQVYNFQFKNNDRAVTENKTTGIAKIITDSKGYIISASVLNERAGEIINEIQVAKKNNIKLSKLANVIHSYPTFGDFLNKLGKEALVNNLRSNPIIKLIRK